MASFAAILAMGNPVALDASAEDLDTRGFISMVIRRPSRGLTANWMLQPPVSTPTSRRMAKPWLRMIWNSRSVSVMAGATVTESPVCTPSASTFSMEHTTTQLSLASRMSSSSYSFHPRMDSSMSTLASGDAASPPPAMRSTSSLVKARPDPRPPMVNDGRTTTGRPSSVTVSRTSSMVWHTRERADSPPIFATMSLNFWRSSPRSMASMSAPMSSTLYLSNEPRRSRAMAAFSAVCPPRVASTASMGCPAAISASKIFSMYSG